MDCTCYAALCSTEIYIATCILHLVNALQEDLHSKSDMVRKLKDSTEGKVEKYVNHQL